MTALSAAPCHKSIRFLKHERPVSGSPAGTAFRRHMVLAVLPQGLEVASGDRQHSGVARYVHGRGRCTENKREPVREESSPVSRDISHILSAPPDGERKITGARRLPFYTAAGEWIFQYSRRCSELVPPTQSKQQQNSWLAHLLTPSLAPYRTRSLPRH